MVVIAHALGGRFALKLCKRHDDAQHGASHRRRRVELLADREKRNAVFLQHFPDPAEVRKGAAEAIQAVDDDPLDLPRFHGFHQFAEGRAPHILTGKAPV